MKTLLKTVYILFMLAIVMTAGGCGSKKSALSSNVGQNTQSWEKLTMPVKIRLDEPQRFSISGNATFVNDQSIIFSFRMLGMEVAAMQLDRDSLVVLDKFHKYFFKAPISDLSKEVNLQIGDIQQLLLGQIPQTLSLKSKGKGFSAEIIETDGLLKEIKVSVSGKEPFTATYGSLLPTPFGYITESITTSGELGTRPFRLSVEWTPSKAKWNDDVSVRPVTVGKGYKEISVDNLKKMFSIESD
ncbi:MAG: DUF4292 domain-containing protein [Paramuribaculum sp.]|nr:DUF4292 domain-containing protein [Paramuribaculum sp.]